MTARLISFPWREHRLSPEEGWRAAELALAVSPLERLERARELRLEDPELLLSVCEVLRSRDESSPANVCADAEFFYNFLETPKRRIGVFDEREYLLGEFALIAGTTNRVLFRREAARRWFDRAESFFVRASNGGAHIGRLAYQRLALQLEERHVEEVLELAPRWFEALAALGMAEEALKCRFLDALALREMGETQKSLAVYREICAEAEAQGNIRLAGQAANNLAQIHMILGEFDEALEYARKALPLLQQLNNRKSLVKLRWCVGAILREQGKPGEAIAAHREALEEARAVGMRGDVAALHLVLADLLLDANQDRQAEWEVRAALPIIDEERMVPEGFAALDLLRQALRYRQIDRKALRELHGYFGDSQA